MNAVSYKNEKIFLNTFMTSLSFAKARFSEKIREPGVIAKKTDGGWEFEKWSFEATEENEEEIVILEGTAFNGKTLKQIFDEESESEEKKALAVYAGALIVNIIEDAVNWNTPLPAVGAGGIFISEDFTQVIFLPELFFTSAVLCSKENIFAAEQGFYINENLKNAASLKFLQNVIAYKCLTSEFPFPEENKSKRDADMLDKNFVSIKNKIPGLHSDVANEIDNALSQEPSMERTRTSRNPKGELNDKEYVKTAINLHLNRFEFFKECGLKEQGALPENKLLIKIDRSSNFNSEAFSKKAERRQKKVESKVNLKRWFRKNRTLLIIAGILLVIGIFVAATYYSTSQEKPTSKGLTSLQTVEMYYSAVNELDVDQALYCVYGSEMKSHTSVLSNIYISEKARAMYNPKIESKPLSKWLCYNQPLYTLAGISQFTVDGNQQKAFFEPQRKNQKPQTLTEENGISLANEQTITHKADYYFILSEKLDEITVTSYTDTVTLTYRKNRWVLTSIERTTNSEEFFSKEEFNSDYEAAVEKCGKDIDAIMEIMKAKYYWMPTDAEMKEAVAVIETEKIY